VQAVAALPVHSCLIDGEAIVCDGKGLAVFQFIRSYRRGNIATLCAFDLIEIDGEDLRWRPIEDRKAALKKLLSRSPPGIEFNKHFDVDGTVVFHHACSVETPRLAISVRPIDRLAQGQEPGCARGQARGGRGLGQQAKGSVTYPRQVISEEYTHGQPS
jgi:hypothetical protein